MPEFSTPGYFPSRRREPENVDSKVLDYVKVENGRRFANVIEGCGKVICYWFLSPGGNEHRPEDGDDLEGHEFSNPRHGKAVLGPFQIGSRVPAAGTLVEPECQGWHA